MDMLLGLRMKRSAQHWCQLESKTLIYQEIHNRWPIFVRKVFGQLVHNFILVSWVHLCNFLKISRKLTNDGLLINAVGHFFDLVLVVIDQSNNRPFDWNLFAHLLLLTVWLEGNIKVRVFDRRVSNIDSQILLIFVNGFSRNYIIHMESKKRQQEYLVGLFLHLDVPCILALVGIMRVLGATVAMLFAQVNWITWASLLYVIQQSSVLFQQHFCFFIYIFKLC